VSLLLRRGTCTVSFYESSIKDVHTDGGEKLSKVDKCGHEGGSIQGGSKKVSCCTVIDISKARQ